MRTVLIPSRISRLFSVDCGFFLFLTVLALTTCTFSIKPDPYSFTVTFNKNGGETRANPQTIQVIEPATTVETLPTAPVREGYIFTGWNTKANGFGIEFTETTTVTANITVYAQWTVLPPLWTP